MIPPSANSTYRTVMRMLGIALSVTAVLFHRRGAMDWREPAFILTCVVLQESFLMLPILRRIRPVLLAFYLMLPAIYVLGSLDVIEPHRGDAIALALQTPLPLVLLPIQLMVLYTREASKLAGLVLVLALFFIVAGLRRQVDDIVWPWLLAVGSLAMFYMAMCYPARIHLNLFPVHEGRSYAPPVANTGGLVRASFFAIVSIAVALTLALTTTFFMAAPRIRISAEPIGAQPQPLPGRNGRTPEGSGTPSGPRRLSSVSSLSDKIELGDFGQIKQSTIKALELRSLRPETPRQSAKPVYLRAYTYGMFDGQSWAPLPTAAEDSRLLPAPRDRRRNLPNARASKPFWKTGSYAVLVFDGGAGSKGELPVSAEPTTLLDLSGNVSWDARAGIIRAPSVSRGSEYGFECREFNFDYAALEELVAGTQPLSVPGDGGTRSATAPTSAYWTLPRALLDKLRDLPLIDEVRSRAWTRTSGEVKTHSPAAAARWLVSYFNNQTRSGGAKFRYSLAQRPEPGFDCIYRFLTSERIGHCEYYASAMCMVLRCAGVPCRLAAGFHASRFDEARNVYEVTASNAHAWVEVYIKDYGWIPFDPTPAADDADIQPDTEPQPEPSAPTPDEPPRPEPEPDAPQPDANPESEQQRDPVINFDDHARQQFVDDISETAVDAYEWAADALGPMTDWMPSFLPQSPLLRAMLLGSPPVLLLVYWAWRRRKRKKLEKRVLDEMGAETLRGATKRQRSLYLSLLLELAKLGFHKKPHETPREFAWRVARRGGPALAPVRELTEIFYRIRYGSDPQREEANFKRLLSAFAEQLRRALSVRPAAAEPPEETGA